MHLGRRFVTDHPTPRVSPRRNSLSPLTLGNTGAGPSTISRQNPREALPREVRAMSERSTPFPLRVLVVDDCPDTTYSMAILLRLWGHDVRIAGDGPSALIAAGDFAPEVVLLDVGLPRMDGYEVA